MIAMISRSEPGVSVPQVMRKVQVWFSSCIIARVLVREGQSSGRKPVELVVGSAIGEAVVVDGDVGCEAVTG